tara:strand:+ start:932 stop:1666 length:735 start_codon:yes stop_codon:yes gene_type:complete
LVEVDGQKAHIGQRIDSQNRVFVNGKKIHLREASSTDILVLNKRVGCVSTRRDEKGRTTIFKDLPKPPHGRWISIGRLDINTSGLMLLTNNGELANRMMHPSSGVDKEYAVRVNGNATDEDLVRLRDGVSINGELVRFSDIQFFDGSGRNNWYHVVLMDGKNREVRNLFESVGLTVSRLKRVRFGPVLLPASLKVGQYSSLLEADIQNLCDLFGLPFLASPEKSKSRMNTSKKTMLIPYPSLGF